MSGVRRPCAARQPSGRTWGRPPGTSRRRSRRLRSAPTRAREAPGGPLHGRGASHARARTGRAGPGVWASNPEKGRGALCVDRALWPRRPLEHWRPTSTLARWGAGALGRWPAGPCAQPLAAPARALPGAPPPSAGRRTSTLARRRTGPYAAWGRCGPWHTGACLGRPSTAARRPQRTGIAPYRWLRRYVYGPHGAPPGPGVDTTVSPGCGQFGPGVRWPRAHFLFFPYKLVRVEWFWWHRAPGGGAMRDGTILDL